MGLKPKKNSSTKAAVQTKTDFSRDLSILLQHANERERLIIRTLIETGIQLQQLVNIKKTDLKRKELAVKERKITISKRLANELARHARTQAHDHIFSTRQSAQLTTRRAEQLIARAAKKADVQITARTIRKAYQAAAAKQARDDKQLRELTGLKTITKTKTLTQNEEGKLAATLKKAPTRNQALIETVLETGKTLKETITLTQQDLQGLPLSTRLERRLKQLATTPEAPLFSTRQSTQITTRRAEQIISEEGKKAGIRLTSHVLATTAKKRGGAP